MWIVKVFKGENRTFVNLLNNLIWMLQMILPVMLSMNPINLLAKI